MVHFNEELVLNIGGDDNMRMWKVLETYKYKEKLIIKVEADDPLTLENEKVKME